MYGIFTYIFHKESTIHVGRYTSPMDGMGTYGMYIWYIYIHVYILFLVISYKLELPPHPVTVTTRIIPFSVGNSKQEPSFVTGILGVKPQPYKQPKKFLTKPI